MELGTRRAKITTTSICRYLYDNNININIIDGDSDCGSNERASMTTKTNIRIQQQSLIKNQCVYKQRQTSNNSQNQNNCNYNYNYYYNDNSNRTRWCTTNATAATVAIASALTRRIIMNLFKISFIISAVSAYSINVVTDGQRRSSITRTTFYSKHRTHYSLKSSSSSSSSSSLLKTTLKTTQNTQLHMSPPSSGSNDNYDDSAEWNAIVAALKLYKTAFGDVNVPQRFVVPDMAPWPKQAWGLRLGIVVQAIRNTGKFVDNYETRRRFLDELGFVWSTSSKSRSSSTTTTKSTKRTTTENNIDVDDDDDDDDDDDEEIVPLNQIISAVQAYKQIKGDSITDNNNIIISDNFVIPNTQDWPESVRGLPLGRQLQNIKNGNDEQLKNKFISIGVNMSDENVNVRQEINKQQQAETIAEKKSKTTPGDKSKAPTTLDEIERALESVLGKGKLSANDTRFKKVYTALAIYKNLYGDLLVPQPFTVPSNSQDWPEDIWGLRLGARVNAIRSQGTFVNNSPERRHLLNELEFVWSPPKDGRRGRRPKSEADQDDLSGYEEQPLSSLPSSFSSQMESSSALDSLFDGSFDFGKDFDIPMGANKPAPTWNLEGARLPEEVLKAVEQEALLNEDDYVEPQSFTDTFMEATERALECGVIEGVTENRRVIKGKREKNIPWFNDDFGDDFVFEDVVEALTIYKSMYGDFSNLTNSDFVVPTPKEVTGFLDDDSFDLFDTDASARAAAAIASFEEKGDIDRSEDFIAAEIKRLQDEVEMQSEVATRARTDIIPNSSTETWPEHLAGMALGNIVRRIRDGSLEVKHLPERKKQLDAIDFDWGDSKYFLDIPFEKAMCAMYAYYLVRGDMFVPEDFIMPDEDPWPKALAGYEIGKAVKRIRELQNFFEAYHPEKVSLLRMIDFVWFADTMALPLDPNEKEMTPETLLLSAMGHPDYAKMIDMPMGLPDKIHADGPFFETDDPKLWWRKWHNWDYVKDYWYQQGRRDNAFALRRMGYHKMAEEHEEKYGPGMFAQIDEFLEYLNTTSIKGIDIEEKQDIVQKLLYFREELIGCMDCTFEERDALINEMDTRIEYIMEDINPGIDWTDELERSEYMSAEYIGEMLERNNSKKQDRSTKRGDDDDDLEEIDIDDDLGL